MGGPIDKPEFPPLLPLGRHPFTLERLVELCVTPFPKSPTRQRIWEGFLQVVDRLNQAKIVGELWLDGSYLTRKVDPEDMDLVLRMDGCFADHCEPDQQAIIEWVQSDLHDSHHCHSFVIVQWPKNHPDYWRGEYAYAYWMKQWGFSREDNPKGIAVIELPRSDK